jgi:hypothetical protein
MSAVTTVSEMAAVGFNMPQDTFTSLTKNGPHLLAPTGSDLSVYHDKNQIFAGFHYDLNFLTIHGKSRYPGLYIWTRSGKREAVRVPDGCLLVQAGKQMEWLTGGEVLAGFHEVIVSDATLEVRAPRSETCGVNGSHDSSRHSKRLARKVARSGASRAPCSCTLHPTRSCIRSPSMGSPNRPRTLACARASRSPPSWLLSSCARRRRHRLDRCSLSHFPTNKATWCACSPKDASHVFNLLPTLGTPSVARVPQILHAPKAEDVIARQRCRNRDWVEADRTLHGRQETGPRSSQRESHLGSGALTPVSRGCRRSKTPC